MLPLHMVCKYHDNYDVINIIFKKNKNNAQETYNETQLPLHDVVGRDPPLHLDIVWLLMSRSPETVSARMIFGRNVLHIALHVKKVTERLINLLLDTVHKELLQQTADNGMTPLHFAMFASERCYYPFCFE